MKRLSKRASRRLTWALSLTAAAIAFGVWWLFLRRDVVPERTLAHALADMYVVDAFMQDHSVNSSADRTIEEAYHTVLAHYGMTKQDYDTALAWYSRRPELYSHLYERAIDIIAEREALAQAAADRTDSASAAIKALNDSLTQKLFDWPDKWTVPGADKKDTLRRWLKPTPDKCTRVERTLPLDSLSGGRLSFRFRYDVNTFRPGCRPLAQLRVTCGDSVLVDSARLDANRRLMGRDVKLQLQLPGHYDGPTLPGATTDGGGNEQAATAPVEAAAHSANTAPANAIAQSDTTDTTNTAARAQSWATKATISIAHADLRKLELQLRNFEFTYKPYDVADTSAATYGLTEPLGY